MKDFTYYAPTEVAFGKEAEGRIGQLARKHGANKMLMVYGGKSAERSGLLDVVRRQLEAAGIQWVELGGVVPNPLLSKVREGIALAKESDVDFILAVGGGSVIDTAKAIGYGLACEGDVWDLFVGGAKARGCAPVGVVLTIPAAGSEMSSGCVITKDDENLKRAYDDNLCRPRFAVMNPERTCTLPAYQTSCGVVDIMMHTMERYFTHDADRLLIDNMAEALLRTVMECGRKVLDAPNDYALRSQIMWAGSLAHNDITGSREAGDWATHNLEHELSAMYGVAHGAGLAAMWPHWAEYVLDADAERFARFAVNVLGVERAAEDDATATALKGISAMKAFYRSIGMPASIPELIGRKATEAELSELALKCSRGGTSVTGQFKPLTQADVLKVYAMANAAD